MTDEAHFGRDFAEMDLITVPHIFILKWREICKHCSAPRRPLRVSEMSVVLPWPYDCC